MLKKLFMLVSLLFSTQLFAGATEWVDIEVKNGMLLIDAAIEGIPTKALLDTGATQTLVNQAFLDKNQIDYQKGRKVELSGIYGKVDTRQIKNLNVNVLGADLPLKLSNPFYAENSDFDMILGLPFFKNFIFQIDYPNARLRLITHESLDMGKIANVPLKFTDGKRALVATVILNDGDKVNLMLDTGNSGGILFERKFAVKKGWLDQYKVADGKISGALVGGVENEWMQIPGLKFGPYPMENVLVAVPATERRINVAHDKARPEIGKKINTKASYEGILGYDLLKHFVVTLDAKRAKMHIIAE